MKESMAHDVFISHSVKDPDQRAADIFYDYLESMGIKCFMDKRDLIPGVTYHTQLATAIRESKLVILVFSYNADSSKAVQNEIAIATNNKIPIIPIRIEDTLPHELEFFIATPQWLDAFPTPIEKHLPKLLAAVRMHLGVEPPSSETLDEDLPESAQESLTDLITHHEWTDIDSPPAWITKELRLLKELNIGKVITGKTFVYRYNPRTQRYQKKLK